MRLQISVPKAGTRVFGLMTNSQLEPLPLKLGARRPLELFPDLEQISISMMGLQADGHYRAHLPYHPEIENLVESFEVVTLILRDPRDIIVSMAYYIGTTHTSAFNFQVSNKKRLSDLALSERFDFLIEQMPVTFRLFDGWREMAGIELFYYEDYKLHPLDVFSRLSALGFGSAKEIMERSFHKDYGFRVGTIENWKKEFNAAQKTRALENFGNIINAWRRRK